MNSIVEKLKNHPFIVNKSIDLIFLLFMPVLAVVIAAGSFNWFFKQNQMSASNQIHYVVTMIVQFHLLTVFYRAFNNKKIFNTYKNMLITGPIIIFSLLFISSSLFLFISFLAIVWDSYHAGAQVFGIGRIYDAKLGSNTYKGRWLDMTLNMFIHFGPMFWGLSSPELVKHVFNEGGRADDMTSRMSDLLGQIMITSRPFVVIIGLLFLGYYIKQFNKLTNEGYKVSIYKILFYLITFLCNIWIWNVSGPLAALIAINFGHSLQYIVIIWWSENKNISKLFGLTTFLSFIVFLLIGLAYGLWLTDTSNMILGKFALGVALIHYLYDGFIWSTRKNEI